MTYKKGLLNEIGEHRGAFALAFVGVFACMFLVLLSIGATPNPPGQTVGAGAPPGNAVAVDAATGTPQQPLRVAAKDVGLDVSVHNPSSVDIEVLDNALLYGAVRYPTSAELGVDGTVLLFGHSSYLPIVHNQAYKTFDGIQNLKPGEFVSVYSASLEYRYKVVQVKIADATQDAIELKTQGRHLTLVTCDSFAQKSNRFIVTADFVGAYAL